MKKISPYLIFEHNNINYKINKDHIISIENGLHMRYRSIGVVSMFINIKLINDSLNFNFNIDNNNEERNIKNQLEYDRLLKIIQY